MYAARTYGRAEVKEKKMLTDEEIQGREVLDHEYGSVNSSSSISRDPLEAASDTVDVGVTSMSESNCDIKLERCAKHDDKLSIYCDEHELFICGQCKLLDHSGCEKYTYIPHLTEDIFNGEEIVTVLASIDEVKGEVNEANVLAEAAKEKICRLETLAHERIEELRHDVNEVFDDFEKELRKTINELKNRSITKNSSLQDDNKRLLDDVEAEEVHLNDLIQSRRTEMLFRCIKRAKQRIKQFRYRMADIKGNIICDLYTVDSIHLKQSLSETLKRSVILKTENSAEFKAGKEPDTSLARQREHLIDDPIEFDTDSNYKVNDNKATVDNLQVKGIIDLGFAHFEESIDARLGKERAMEVVRWSKTSHTGNGCITDLLVLHYGHLVVVHHADAKVRYFVYLQNQWKLQGQLKLDSGPWAATNLETYPQCIAITLPEETSFAILSIGKNIKVESKHDVGLECRGIAYNLVDQVFVLSVIGSDEFLVFDSSGRPIGSIQLPGKFVNPTFVILSPDGAKMFVSDIHSRTVSRVDIATQSVDWCYTGDSNCRPFGMKLVNSDLFVCDCGSHELLRIEAYRDMHCMHRYSKELLTCQSAVAICLQTRQVFLSKDNFINVFSL